MFQSMFYVFWSAIGLAVLYLVLVPFIGEHPIDFPFSDGILCSSLVWHHGARWHFGLVDDHRRIYSCSHDYSKEYAGLNIGQEITG